MKTNKKSPHAKKHDHSHHDHESHGVDFASLAERLKNSELKATPTRLAILKCFAGAHKLLTIDEIVREINRRSKRAYDWSTVYRCMIKFQEAGFVSAVKLEEGPPHYELRETSGHHHHVICTKCKCVTPIEHCSVEELQDSVAAMGFTALTHSLEFFGICSHCQGA